MGAAQERNKRKENQVLAVNKAKQPISSDKRATLVITAVTVLIIIGIIAGVLLSGAFSNTSARSEMIAVEIGGIEVTVPEFDYYYFQYVNRIAYPENGATPSGLDINKSLRLQLAQNGTQTWDEYFKELTINELHQNISLYKEALETNMTLSGMYKGYYEDQIKNIKQAASSAGMTFDTYLKTYTANGMTEKLYREILKRDCLAQQYAESIKEGFTFTDEELNSFYEANKDDMDSVAFNLIRIPFVEETPEMTDEEQTPTLDDAAVEQAKEAARAKADEMLAKITDNMTTEELEALNKEYFPALYEVPEPAADEASDEAGEETETQTPDEPSEPAVYTYYEDILRSYMTGIPNVSEWLFSAERTKGERTLIEETQEYYIVVFARRNKDDVSSFDVRSISFPFNTNGTEPTEKEIENAKKKAESFEATWNKGEKTEASFGELVKKESTSSIAKENGGLSTDTGRDYLNEEFNEWVFSSDRKPNDIKLFELNAAFVLSCFVRESDPYWKLSIRETLAEEKMTVFIKGKKDKYPFSLDEKGYIYAGDVRTDAS